LVCTEIETIDRELSMGNNGLAPTQRTDDGDFLMTLRKQRGVRFFLLSAIIIILPLSLSLTLFFDRMFVLLPLLP